MDTWSGKKWIKALGAGVMWGGDGRGGGGGGDGSSCVIGKSLGDGNRCEGKTCQPFSFPNCRSVLWDKAPFPHANYSSSLDKDEICLE